MRTFQCAKCDYDQVRVKYTVIDPAQISRSPDFIKGKSEHLACRCERCGFDWYEQVAPEKTKEH